MAKIKVAINGFGRIGRAAFKIALDRRELEVVAVNDLTDNKTLAHLLKYDSVYGRFNKEVEADGEYLIVGKNRIKSFAVKEPAQLPWGDLGVDVVLECTGVFRTREAAGAHLKAGARKVILSAPAKGGDIATFVKGVNDNKYNGQDIIDNASCTTNCVAPVMAVVLSKWGIKKAMMTTIHSYTSDQNLVDGPHKDLRRARSAAVNIVPTSTGAAKATAEAIPELLNKFDGLSLRVPTAVVSLSDFTIVTEKPVSKEEVNQAFIAAAKLPLYKNVLAVTDEPIVSSDIIGNSHSAIVDIGLTQVVGGDLLKIIAWYDNEWGYANRLVEMAEVVGK